MEWDHLCGNRILSNIEGISASCGIDRTANQCNNNTRLESHSYQLRIMAWLQNIRILRASIALRRWLLVNNWKAEWCRYSFLNQFPNRHYGSAQSVRYGSQLERVRIGNESSRYWVYYWFFRDSGNRCRFHNWRQLPVNPVLSNFNAILTSH